MCIVSVCVYVWCVCLCKWHIRTCTCYVELLIHLHTNTLVSHCMDWQTLTDAPHMSAVSAEKYCVTCTSDK